MLLDYDIYVTVALKLLDGNSEPYYSESNEIIQNILDAIDKKGVDTFELFSRTPRTIDFSQFTPRGHYTNSEELSRYFQAMMWLGRIELYLIPPISDDKPQTFNDIQRQIIDALLILKATKETSRSATINIIEFVYKLLIGESDNINLNQLFEIMNECKLDDPINLLDSMNVVKFQNTLKQKINADQKILSQILWSNDPFRTDYIKPATAFMMFGQRFILDSYVLSNVVYDKIKHRMLPNSLDMLFVLGNNSASDLLKHELNRYDDLPRNLAGLRYLMDSNDEEFWSSTFYNGWLYSIRTLRPPDDEARKELPEFMQTAAWWQEKMNTQCASWAQLRHDNLLYSKQSYSGFVCSFPYVFVEIGRAHV